LKKKMTSGFSPGSSKTKGGKKGKVRDLVEGKRKEKKDRHKKGGY